MSPTENPVVRVGVGVILVRDGKVLLGKRKGAHGSGLWGFPGGHLEWFESFEDCARREVTEESGLTIAEPRFVYATNDVMEADGKHYVTIFMRADCPEGEPQNLEPEKLERWEWHPWDALPAPLFTPIVHLRTQGYRPF